MSRFQVVEQTTEESTESAVDKAGMQMFMLGLKALSARALAAIADLFMLATVGSAFWLWLQNPKPDVYQIVSLTLYGIFVLAANWIVRARR